MAILKLKPAYKDYIWGGNNLVKEYNKEFDGDILAETWELSSHKDGPSVIANGEYNGKTLADFLADKGKTVVGKNCEKFEDFPVLIKFIDAKSNLSIQVHPDDEYALKNENQYGKTEMWYVVSAKEGAFLYYGFNKEVSKDEFEQRIKNNTLLDVLNKVYVQNGDVLFIEAGTIHAICEDIIIAEIQQNSNVTYRVYDYGRVDANGNARELHIEKAVEVTNTKALSRSTNMLPHIAKCDYFTVDKIYLDNKTYKNITLNATENSFISILVLSGSGIISSENETVEFKKGDSIFVTANHGEFLVQGEIEALVTQVD